MPKSLAFAPNVCMFLSMSRNTENQPDLGPMLVGFTEAARSLGVTESWLRRAATAKTIPHRRIGRAIRFSPDDLAAIVAACAVTPDSTADVMPLRPSRRSA